MVESKQTIGTWNDVLNAARTTSRKPDTDKEPSSDWKRRILLAEHSPIRELSISVVVAIKSWVSVHFVRHHEGINHYVSTQRTDRTGIERDDLPQGESVRHRFTANQQAIINISRKRLCNCASKQTRDAWKDFLESIKGEHPELYAACVPDCVYRGWCYELENASCGYHTSWKYKLALSIYRSGVNGAA